MSGFHRDIKGDQNHVIHFREYADKDAREAATGLDATHLHKVALQTDTNTFWVLLDAAPVTWKELAPEPPPPETPVHGKIEMFWGTINSDGRPIDVKTGLPDMRYGYCDGRTYAAPDGRQVTTPNMRERFPVCSGDNASNKGQTGGASSITQSSAQMKSHNHALKTYKYSGSSASTVNPVGSHQYNTSGAYVTSAGGSSAMENRPPYMSIPFIMYL